MIEEDCLFSKDSCLFTEHSSEPATNKYTYKLNGVARKIEDALTASSPDILRESCIFISVSALIRYRFAFRFHPVLFYRYISFS